jgi:iron complex transport system ATP-binding protein
MRCLGARALARRRALLTQKPGCAPDLTVAEVVAMGRAPWGALRFDAAARRSLERVDLAIYADTPIGRLSGGEQQRVHLARALAQIAEPGIPRAFLLDEPTNHLDPAWGWRLAEILDEEARAGALIVIVLHDVGLASTLASRLLVLGGGRVLGDGAPPEALRPEAVRAAFGLEATFLTVGGRARAVLHPPEVP